MKILEESDCFSPSQRETTQTLTGLSTTWALTVIFAWVITSLVLETSLINFSSQLSTFKTRCLRASLKRTLLLVQLKVSRASRSCSKQNRPLMKAQHKMWSIKWQVQCGTTSIECAKLLVWFLISIPPRNNGSALTQINTTKISMGRIIKRHTVYMQTCDWRTQTSCASKTWMKHW